METVTATEAKNNLGAIMAQALHAPVMIEKNGRPMVVMMSAESYAQHDVQERKEAFLKLCDELADKARSRGLTEEILQSILAEE